MASAPTIPNFILGGGSAGKGAGLNNPGQLEQIYGNLLSSAADIVQGLHTKVLVLDAGAIGTAGSSQTDQTETAAEVAGNLQVLKNIAAFCTANGIVVQVDADLTYSATNPGGSNALVMQWVTAAATAGLPIASVEDVAEIGISEQPTAFASYATIETNAVQTIINAYAKSTYKMSSGNLAVGDMEGGGASKMMANSEWWNAYDSAATNAGLPQLSFVTADIGWFAPWIDPLSTPTNDGVLETLSALAASRKMALNVVVEGSQTDSSASQYIIQSEQNAIHLAELEASGSVVVNSVLVRSWDVQPVGVGAISSPTSTTNDAAELEGVYPLYEVGSITAQGSVAVTAPGQLVIGTGVAGTIPRLSLQWESADIIAGARIGVVVVDQTGTLTATQFGSGSVSNPSSNILVLNGDSADLASELSSITVKEANSGPDTIDIETYGTAGRLSDNQITVLAAASGQSVDAINATSNSQGWVTSSALLNNGTVIASGDVLISETLQWNISGSLAGTITGTTVPGQSAFVKIDAIHEPLAEYGIQSATTTLPAAAANAVVSVNNPSVASPAFAGGGYANNPGVNDVAFAPLPGWLGNSFNPVTELTSLIVRSTTNTFSSITGQLETSMDSLVPDPLTVVDLTGSHSDTFATAFTNGGTQVTEYNTAGNPAWQAGWGNQFASATLTYDDAGQLVEAFLQGGTNDPLYTIDDVFDPGSGQLWEQFQSTTPPGEASGSSDYNGTSDPYYNGFATGPVYVTQFQGSPNWDYVDWGTSVQADTEVWVDNFIINNFSGFAVSFPGQYSGDLNAYPYQFTNGPDLDLMYLPGSINVNLNDLRTIIVASQTLSSGFSGLTEIDAAGATGSTTITGLQGGGSTLIGGDNISTINGYGNDTIVAGAGITTVNTGSGGSTVSILSGASSVSVTGSNNIINALVGGTISVIGSGEILNATSAVVTVASNTTLTINGSQDVISLDGPGITLNLEGRQNHVFVSDSSQDIVAHLDALQALAANGELVSINFTDSGTPTLTLSATQPLSDTSALALINGPYIIGTTPTSTLVNQVSKSVPEVAASTGNATATPSSLIVTPIQAAVIAFDTTTNQMASVVAQEYTGPVAGLQSELIDITSDSLNMTANTANWFLHSGSGEDALAANSGTNVLDGGTGSNFLVGGSGTDTFFADARGATGAIWDTIVNFHAGDAVTIWGVTPNDFALTFSDNQGAAGYTGLTLAANAQGLPNVSVTFAGFTTADLNSGKIAETFGNVGGSSYAYFREMSEPESRNITVTKSIRRIVVPYGTTLSPRVLLGALLKLPTLDIEDTIEELISELNVRCGDPNDEPDPEEGVL
jgi:hypothetical protein